MFKYVLYYYRACACTEDVLVTHALTPSGPMMRRLLQYVWSLWEDPVDVGHMYVMLIT